MDERQYRSTYHEINPERCVFEKAINSRVCNCSKSKRFNLADREGVACNSNSGLIRCGQLISLIRENAKFALNDFNTEKPLGHAQQSKLQNGGLLGLQMQLNINQKNVEDIDSLLESALQEFKTLEEFPYSKMMQMLSLYRIRKKRSRKNL